MAATAALDVGGAHLKIARTDGGKLAAVRQIACPMWQGLGELDAALDQAAPELAAADCVAITMTAELTEIFDSREAGVLALVDRLSKRFGAPARFYLGLKGLGTADQVRRDPLLAASANFLATAALISQRQPKALLIDFGSTTADIIACDRPQGLSDAERLQTGELVYTGCTRTPVPSVTTRAPLAGQWQTLARDGFATMADVRRILGLLDEDADLHATADGRGKSVHDSLSRLARGFGRDAEVRHLHVWQAAAAHIREAQLRSIHDGALQVASRPGLELTSVVAAGIGAADAHEVARRLGLLCTTFGSLAGCDGALEREATNAAPAAALALLAAKSA